MKLTKTKLKEIIREEILSIKESTNLKDRFSSKLAKQIENVFKRELGVKRVVVEGPSGGGRVMNVVTYWFYVPHPMHGNNLMISNRITVKKALFADTSYDYYTITVSQGRSEVDEITASNDGALLKAVSTMAKKHKKLLTYTS